MENNNKCYVVVYNEIPYSNDRSVYRDINGIYRNCEEAVSCVRQYADQVIAESKDLALPTKIVWNAPSCSWPWLFTWVYNECQYTYKVVPYEYKDRKTES